MSERALQQFVTNDDLLHCLGENIKSTNLLYNLCLTNKLFNLCFTPFLYKTVVTQALNYVYRELDEPKPPAKSKFSGDTAPVAHCAVCEDKWPPDGDAYDIDLDRNPNVRHVQELSFGFSYGPRHVRVLEMADRLLSQITNLQRLSVNTVCDVRLLYLISVRYPLLKSLTLICHDEGDVNNRGGPDLALGPQPAINFTTFTHLRSLCLDNIMTGGTISGPDVVVMLLAAPQLQELALSCYFEPWGDWIVDERWSAVNFMPNLCAAYENGGGTPLKLRKLHLGPHIQLTSSLMLWMMESVLAGMGPDLNFDESPPSVRTKAAAYLEKLSDLSFLEELAVDNYPPSHDPEYEAFVRLVKKGFAWDTFTEKRTPRLRLLWVTQLDNSVFDWIHDHAAFVPGYGRQVTIRYGRQCQMNGVLGSLTAMGWEPRQLELDLGYEFQSHAQAIDHIATHSSQLEGLSLVPMESHTDQDCSFFGGLIARLPSLKVFRLRRILFSPSGQDDWEPSRSFWEPDLGLLTYLVRDSVCLKYIMVGAYAWTIIRNQDGRPVKLQGMGCNEWQDIELFREFPLCNLYDEQKPPAKWTGYRGYSLRTGHLRRSRDLLLPRRGPLRSRRTLTSTK